MRALAWLMIVAALTSAALLATLRWQPQWLAPEWIDRLPAGLVAVVNPVLQPPDSPRRDASSPAEGRTEVPAIYAWKDDQGQWHYTDTPPANRPFEVRRYDSEINVVPAYQAEPDDG